VLPLVENPGALLQPKLQVFVVDESRRVIAGPLVVGRRRAYHREWLLSFAGITSREAVDGWRDQFIAVLEPDARD
jgi:hypothetical protein